MCEYERLFTGNKDNDGEPISKANVHDDLTDLVTHIRMTAILNNNISDLEEKIKKTRSRTTKAQLRVGLSDLHSDRLNIAGLIRMMFDKYDYINND